MKLSPEQINEIITLKNKEIGVTELCKRFNVAKKTIYWHTDSAYREKEREYQRRRYNNLTKEQKRELQNKRKEYQRNYHKDRYAHDQEFRRKQLEFVKKGRIEMKGGIK